MRSVSITDLGKADQDYLKSRLEDFAGTGIVGLGNRGAAMSTKIEPC